jgi:hypothetical protein
MADRRFLDLQDALLRAGVAARHVRRALAEIEGHFELLVDAAAARGATHAEARLEAHAVIGSDETIIRRFADQPELRAWSSRRPALCFTVLPLAGFLALSLAAVAILYLLAERMSPHLHGAHIPIDVSHRIDLAVQVLFLWIFPLLVAAAFAVLAYRQRIAFRWPAVGIVGLCVMTSLISLDLWLTGGVRPGEASAGIGISATSLPGQAGRAMAIAVLVLVPLRFAMSRLRPGRALD